MTSLGRYVTALRNCGLRSSDRVAVALSGGPDSLALASMTVWWQGFVRSKQAPLALIVDHKLRLESTKEAHAVAEQAAGLGMQTRVLTVDWPPGEHSPGDRMVAAREARYKALLRACGELGSSTLLLAHHADDQAETFLLRLLHASGVAGLACMPRVAERQTEFGRVRVVRPLLGFHKAELEAYCQHTGLQYVCDPTNAELSYHRNRIRRVLQDFPAPPPLDEASVGPGAGIGAAVGSLGSLSSTHDSSRAPQGLLSAAQPGYQAESSWQQAEELQEGAGGKRSSALHGTSSSDGSRSNSGAFSSDSSSLSSGDSSAGGSIVADVLSLQQRCEAAMLRQQALGDRLLEWGVLHSSCQNLPKRQHKEGQQGQSRHGRELEMEEAESRCRQQNSRRGVAAAKWRLWAEQKPWFIQWDERLAQVAQALRGRPYALLSAPAFSEKQAQEQVAIGALSRVLQAVSGSKYPPPLAQTIRLRQLLAPGSVHLNFTIGGCIVKPLVRSKGRYLLCVPHDQHAWVDERLKQLPPINAFETARQKRKAEAAAAAAAQVAAGLAAVQTEAEIGW